MAKSVLVALVLASGLFAADLSEKFAKRLESADAAYQTAVQKADNIRFYAVQKASQDRLKVLKSVLTEATKTGDFDAATEIKARAEAAEVVDIPDPADAVRGRPQFIAGLYGVNQSWLDVTDKLNSLAQRKTGFPVTVTDELFGDPAPQFPGGNTLVVRYLLNNKIHTSAVYVGREFTPQ